MTMTTNPMKIRLQPWIGFFTIVLLAGAAARAQSIYSTPAPFVTIAGKAGSPGTADGTGAAAQFNSPAGIAEDTHSNLYVVDRYKGTIRMLTPAGTNWMVTTIAGTPGAASSDADGTNGAARFDDPVGIAVDTNGNLYVGENNGSTIRKITPAGTNWVVTTIAGQPEVWDYADGTNGAALFNGPQNLTVDTRGNLYVADFYNSVIRKVSPVGSNWVVTTIAGQPLQPGYADGTDGAASFYTPYGLALDGAGNLYVADKYAASGGIIRKLTPVGTDWVVSTIAGNAAMSGDADGTNNAALFNDPLGLAMDSISNLYVADYGNYTIRKLAPSGTNWVASTIAGVTGVFGFSDGTGTNALFNQPWGATVDDAGNLFVTDIGSATIRLGLVPLPPVAGFGGSPASGVVPLTVTFTNFSSHATNYVWNFGDGTLLSIGSSTNVAETYTNAGAYTVILTAQGPGGVISLTNPAYIVATNPPLPVAAFAGTPTSGTAPLTVTFTNLSSNATNYVWNFGDGNTLSTGSKNSMANTYTNAGTYTVSLTAQGPGGVTSLTNPAYIVVTPPSSPPTVPNPTIQFVGGNSVVVSWPNTGNFTLQTNGNLTMPNWANYGGPVTTSNGTNRVTVALPPTGYLFFRLTNQQAQNPAVPNLTIGLALNSVVVSWPNTGSFTLQTNGNLATPNWGNYGGTINTGNGTNSATLAPLPGSWFFRLAH